MRVFARTRKQIVRRALVVAAAVLTDRLLGDPPDRLHFVAWTGRFASWMERKLYADARSAGAVVVGLTVTACGIAAKAALSLASALAGGVGRLLTEVALVWLCLGGASLRKRAEGVAGLVESGRQEAAAAEVRELVSRKVPDDDPAAILGAAFDTVAENSNDAVVAPVLYALAFGPIGAVMHRTVDTLDSMFGYRSPRYRRFGWAAAKLDDFAAWVPARVAAACAATLAPLARGSWRRAIAGARAYGSLHPSPNAGVVEGAFAGALGVRSGGVRSSFAESTAVESGDRPPAPDPAAAYLGESRDPTPADVRRAVRLLDWTERLAVAALVAVAIGAGTDRGLP